MIRLKHILKDPRFIPQCCSCTRPSEDCLAVEIDTEYNCASRSFIICKNCLKELQKQIKEQIDD